jgi:hypothetical protein
MGLSRLMLLAKVALELRPRSLVIVLMRRRKTEAQNNAGASMVYGTMMGRRAWREWGGCGRV